MNLIRISILVILGTCAQVHGNMDICHRDFVGEDADEYVVEDIQVMKGEPGQFSINNVFGYHNNTSETCKLHRSIIQISAVIYPSYLHDKGYMDNYSINAIFSIYMNVSLCLPSIIEQKLVKLDKFQLLHQKRSCLYSIR